MARDNEYGIRLFKRAEKLRAARSSIFDPAWQEISQYFLPDLSDINTQKTEGTTGWFDRIYESTPIRAASTCSVGVRNWVTPSTDPWLMLVPPHNLANRKMQLEMGPAVARLMSPPQAPGADEDDIAEDDAQKWLAYTTEELLQELASSNFYSVVQPFNRGTCVFGTGLMFLEEGKTELFKFEQFKVGTFVIAENDQKVVDTVVRWFKLTVRQAVQKFGEDALPKKMREAYGKGNFDTMFEFMHHVFPNEDFEAGALGAKGKAFSSIYQSVEDKAIVQESGYDEMPYFCLRWSRWGTDDQAYGCSPAFETLMEARQLNFVTQYQDALAELKAFPRLLYPDNLDGNVQLAAGGVTTYDSENPNALPREWLSGGDYQNTKEMLEEKRRAINKAFFVDIFEMFDQLDEQGKFQRTAYEIAQRLGAKLDKFTGTFDQYICDVINLMVRRMMGIAWRAGRLTEPPESLMVAPDPDSPPQLAVPKIVINSRVTLAIKALRNTATQNTLTTLLPLAEARPEILDNFDLDKIARDTGRNFGMSERDFRRMKQVIEMRAIRQQQMAQERAAMLAEQTSKAAKNLGGAPQSMQRAAADQLASAGAS